MFQRCRDREERIRERDDRDRRMPNRDREDRDRQALPRDHEERIREKDERDRREKDKERDDGHLRDRRDDDRHIEKKDYDKDRYRDDRDRHRQDDKTRPREKDRREREYEAEKDRDRHERYERRSVERKKSNRKSLTPYSQKFKGDTKDLSPERAKKKEKDHEEKIEEKKKEKKIKEKKKKKDSDEKEKKKKKKKDKKSSQKEAIPKDDPNKTIETEDALVENKTIDDASSSPLKIDSTMICNEEDNIENRIECIPSEISITPSIKEEFEDKSLAMNPEPPEFRESSPGRIDHTEFGTNPPNPNFKPIPELKSDIKPTIDSLYGGLEDAGINTVITDKYSIMSEQNESEMKESVPTEKSPKKDEFLAPIPELSKWERDDTIEKPDDDEDEDDEARGSPTEKMQTDEPKSTKMVTSEVLKRAENAIFQKAINAIRPIEIKKISESRKILYQNPEPKVLEVVEPGSGGPNREPRKSVNVTINVGRNERNVEITEPTKKAKLDRTKFKPVPETYSPTRLSAKERLGEKVEDSKEKKVSPIKSYLERRDAKSDNQSRSRSPRREKKISPILERRIESSSLGLTGSERKVFLEERKRDKDKGSGDRSKDRSDFRGTDRHELRPERENRIDCRTDFRSNRSEVKGERSADKDREKERDRERRGRTPSAAGTFKRTTDIPKMSLLKSKDDEEERKRDKKAREEKKRKKEHRSRSKSKEHKKRKEKKHKKDKDKNQEKKQKHKESNTAAALKEKSDGNETKITAYETAEPPLTESLKKQRKNPRLVSDRKRSILDEANFEPDYSASDSESDGEDKMLLSAKKLKLDEPELDKEIEIKSLKKRSKSSSSEDTSTSSDSTSSDSDSSDESHRKKRKKHKKHKKKKSTKKESSSDSDTYSDSSDSSSDEERHKKKSKKSKNRSKQSKKKKKSKHK